MSRRRKEKNRTKKARETHEQRIRISRSNIRTPILQESLSDRGYPSSLRFKADCQPLKEYLEGHEHEFIPTTCKGFETFNFQRKAKLVP